MSRSGRIVVVMAMLLAIAGVGAALGLVRAGFGEDAIAVSSVVPPAARAESPPAASTECFSCTTGRYFVVEIPSTSQSGCPGMLPLCCDTAYVLCDDVLAACSGQPGSTLYLKVRAAEPSLCCDCEHTACIEVTLTEETILNLGDDPCILEVDGCYVTCSGCINDLP